MKDRDKTLAEKYTDEDNSLGNRMKDRDKTLAEKYIYDELGKCEEQLFEEKIMEDEQSLEEYITSLEASIKEQKESSKVFTDSVMKLLDEDINKEKEIKKINKKNKKVNLLISYASAATITIIFSLAGVFDVASNNVTHKVYASDTKHEYNKIIKEGWTDRLTSSTSAIINSVIYGEEEKNGKEK